MSEVVCKPESLTPGRPFATDARKCATGEVVWNYVLIRAVVEADDGNARASAIGLLLGFGGPY